MIEQMSAYREARRDGYKITIVKNHPRRSKALLEGKEILIGLADQDDEETVTAWAVETAKKGGYRPVREFLRKEGAGYDGE